MAKECNNSSCDKSSCEGCASKGKSEPQNFLAPANIFSDVKHVIGVVSGKGGVGKSFVTGSLANAMAAKGYKVGILDADITGPSIPKMYGLTGAAQADDNGIYPMETANGIKVMSINLLLPTEDTPVIWRGPVLANMVKQFWNRCSMGQDRLSLCRYAARNRRCTAYRIPVSSDPGNRNCKLTAGSGQDDCEEGIQYGWNDEDSGTWDHRKLQLCKMP